MDNRPMRLCRPSNADPTAGCVRLPAMAYERPGGFDVTLIQALTSENDGVFRADPPVDSSDLDPDPGTAFVTRENAGLGTRGERRLIGVEALAGAIA